LYSEPYIGAVKSRRLRCVWNTWSGMHIRFWRENQMQRYFEDQDGRIILKRSERDMIGTNLFGLE
jgi:uncharacterized protein (DUF885 family)